MSEGVALQSSCPDETRETSWPAVEYETLPWHRNPDELMGVSKTRRRKILSTYEAAIPALIANLDVSLPMELCNRMAELSASLARFDAQQTARGYNLPSLLLRSESAASSQIENLTSSVRNITLAELSDTAPANARLIVGNLAAMRCALQLEDDLSIDGIRTIHRELINRGTCDNHGGQSVGQSFGGEVRSEQVWVGGTAYSPHGALFVPPAAERVLGYLEDLVAFSRREDVNPISKAALTHAQFETVHPFIDGNGRTGRTILHKMLRRDGVLEHTTLPISAGLLHNTHAYMEAIRDYQNGRPIPIVAQFVEALELAVTLGNVVAQRLDAVVDGWRSKIDERAGSAIHRLADVLIEQPVVDSAYIAQSLGVTRRSATSIIERARSYGILRPVGGRMRGGCFQADKLLEVLEEISDMHGIRRVLAGM